MIKSFLAKLQVVLGITKEVPTKDIFAKTFQVLEIFITKERLFQKSQFPENVVPLDFPNILRHFYPLFL